MEDSGQSTTIGQWFIDDGSCQDSLPRTTPHIDAMTCILTASITLQNGIRLRETNETKGEMLRLAAWDVSILIPLICSFWVPA